jgi:hypothetical protein
MLKTDAKENHSAKRKETGHMTETTTKEQIGDWETELAVAMDDRRWRRALQLCSWLRYALAEQGRSDPEVEQQHRQAKEALAEQVTQERAQQAHQKEHRRLELTARRQAASGTWIQALDSIEAFYRNGADHQEALGLLQELKTRLSDRLLPIHQQLDPKAAALARRFNELLDQVRGDS